MSRFPSCLTAMIFVIITASCATRSDPLIGAWIDRSGREYFFRNNGSGVMRFDEAEYLKYNKDLVGAEQPFEWRRNGAEYLLIWHTTVASEGRVQPMKINKGDLIIDDGDTWDTLHRKGQAERSDGGRAGKSGSLESIFGK